MSSNNEQIKLTLPINAAYVSAARLTASSVANRLNFDIEEIEDIKVAVSEACTYIIKNPKLNDKNDFKMEFDFTKDNIKIMFSVLSDSKINVDEDEMSLKVIGAIMDKLAFDFDNSSFKMIIEKKHIDDSFGE